MPELPEVETIIRQLQNKISGKKIQQVIVKDGRLIKNIKLAKFKTQVENKIIKEIFRRGKVIILKLSENLFLIIHLRINGWLALAEKEEPYLKVGFKFSDKLMLQFCDSRVLGEIKLVDDWHKLSIIQNMGPEPLETKKDDFLKLFKDRKTKIKPLLLDQTFIAGLGNIYAQEALFCARIHPERNANSLTPKELVKLYECIVKILKKAIECKGSSSDTYKQIDGSKGTYCNLHRVYQRQGEPCFACKNLIKRISQGGRGTCFCSTCQH